MIVGPLSNQHSEGFECSKIVCRLLVPMDRKHKK